MKVKGWVVIWKREKGEKGIDIIGSDDRVTGVVVDYPVFEMKKDAEEFRQKNPEWEIVPVTISV